MSPLPKRALDHLLALLGAFLGAGVTNQYAMHDPALDLAEGPAIRRANLRRYLEAFAGARYVLVGEAAGYAGCRFSGIPFTGEAQIVGPEQLPWAEGIGLRQSSTGTLWRERSGTIVWEALGVRRDCVLWNAFPWHPHGAGPLSNRRPMRIELDAGSELLRDLLALYPGASVYAVGRVSQDALARIGVRAPYVRHPSHGGKTAFTRAVRSLPRRNGPVPDPLA